MNPVLALDSSGKTAGVCVLQHDKILYEKTLDQGLTHSETLLPLVQQALDSTGLLPAHLGCIALTVGPGSFTGLRIAMAIVKGMALPDHLPVVPVSTLEAAACASGQQHGIVISALDARRSQLYWAAFEAGKQLHRLTPDSIGTFEEIGRFLSNQSQPVCFVGDGADLCYNRYNCNELVTRLAVDMPLPIARGAGMIALKTNVLEYHSACDLAPAYLRLSQAERERENKQKIQQG